MVEFRGELNGVMWICKSDGTAEIEEGCARLSGDMVFRGFIEYGGRRYFLNKICGFKGLEVVIVAIANGIKEIGADCFQECRNLSEVIFESDSGLKEIGAEAFSNCRMKAMNSKYG
jgi:hypothetical protein